MSDDAVRLPAIDHDGHAIDDVAEHLERIAIETARMKAAHQRVYDRDTYPEGDRDG